MVEQFTRRTVKEEGGIRPDLWIQQYVVGGSLRGDDKVNVMLANGKTDSVPRNQACLVFRNLETLREEDTGNRGGAPAVTATPQVELVPLYEGMRAIWGYEPFQTGAAKRGDVLIPLGLPTSINDRVVFQQMARLWVSKGANDISMDDHNVVNMLMVGH